MLARALVVTALLVPTVLLAGCVGCAQGPPVTARDIAADAPAAGGSGAYALRVLVTDEPGGPAVEGAGVVVYWARDDAASWDGNGTVRIEGDGFAGPDGASGSGSVVVDVPTVGATTPEPRQTLRLATGADGVALARVPENRIVGVVVAKDGHTEEWLPAVATGDNATASTLTVPLYRARLEVAYDDTWGPGGASPATVTDDDHRWKPAEVPFADDPEVRRGYVARMVELRATLTWTNGAAGAGDLGVGLGATQGAPAAYVDDEDQVTPGEHAEEALFDSTRLAELALIGAPTAYVGPATDSAFVGPFGLPYTMAVAARFDTALANYARCASLGEAGDRDAPLAWLAVPVALLAAGLVAGRGRR